MATIRCCCGRPTQDGGRPVPAPGWASSSGRSCLSSSKGRSVVRCVMNTAMTLGPQVHQEAQEPGPAEQAPGLPASRGAHPLNGHGAGRGGTDRPRDGQGSWRVGAPHQHAPGVHARRRAAPARTPHRLGPPQEHQRQGRAGQRGAGRRTAGPGLCQRPQGHQAALRRLGHGQRGLHAGRRADPVLNRPGPFARACGRPSPTRTCGPPGTAGGLRCSAVRAR